MRRTNENRKSIINVLVLVEKNSSNLRLNYQGLKINLLRLVMSHMIPQLLRRYVERYKH